ncbi:winged helix-turn-helix domain-containing protein [Formosa maritima]|uniref:Winged helix-turn-helix transcriptional regulator n=1 Tax=Formosa maritima TaxID=2592046 RepID=A0A5D0GN67_9FLAO|nr:winged helix-turn-helix domain-containing protein [Formosa maritima]TYA59002.1 winged helix-turn-helix transcriptional regulator [Formosa maritima]
MNKRKIFIISGFISIVVSIWMITNLDKDKTTLSERVKVALRSVGNQLLLTNQDSTSLILPIIALENNKYQLSFQKPLTFEPGQLVSIIESSFIKAALPSNYIVETVQCEAKKVAYSYQILNTVENNIVPCKGRTLPESCYTIEVLFIDIDNATSSKQAFHYVLLCSGFLLLIIGLYKRKQIYEKEANSEDYATLGSFQFYPEQNKLVKQAEEISLSKKECELLEIFVANPNQVIKRDELTKKVWEDHGVFVGRSLDTYISKLRKKLESDDSIKITNVHGVGYKLEVLH